MKFSYKSFLPFGLLLVIFSATAQMNSQQATEHAYQQEQIFQNQIRQEQAIRDGNNSSEQAAAAQREAQRQWQIRENKIQREIAELKRTPFYGAIATRADFKKFAWGGGHRTKELAIKKIMNLCAMPDCELVATFANTCAMISEPNKGPRSIDDLFIAFDNDPEKAILKSIRSCESKFGSSNCGYWGNGKNAFCSGYIYKSYKENEK